MFLKSRIRVYYGSIKSCSCSLGLLHFAWLVKSHLGDEHKVVLVDLSILEIFLSLLFELTLSFFFSFSFSLDSLFFFNNFHLSSISFFVLFPAFDLWDFVDANCRSIVLEDSEFFMIQDPLSRLLSKSDEAVSFAFAILAQSLDFVAVDTTISVLTCLPEGGKTDNDLRDLPNWIP